MNDDTPQRSFDAYFGDPWPSGVCDEGHQVPTPLGELCMLCGEPIQVFDRGSFVGLGTYIDLAPVHRECSLREVLGGIGHFEDHAKWCGEKHDPDGGRTRRQSSLEVWDWVRQHGV